MGTARAHLEATPPERQPGQKAKPASEAHAPHSTASASDAQPNARQRPPPAAPPQGGRHRGGVGAPLEGTYFQAKLGNAMCVQSLDDSLNSAIHITYRISLRSSSLREPRYPSTGVVVRFVVGRARVGLARAVGWGGARQCQASARSRTARSRQFRITTRGRICPRAPNPRHTGAGGGTQRPSRGRPAAPTPRSRSPFARGSEWIPVMILPQVHLRKPCYDFSFL